MAEYGRPGRRRTEGRPEARAETYHDRDIGDDALAFARWFAKDRFQLMEGFLHELERAPGERDAAALKARFLHAVRHARTVLALRGVVTVLLAFSVVATAASTLLDNLAALNQRLPALLDMPVDQLRALLLGIQAVSAAGALVFLVLRLAFDRYLELIQVTATYTAMQLAAEPR